MTAAESARAQGRAYNLARTGAAVATALSAAAAPVAVVPPAEIPPTLARILRPQQTSVWMLPQLASITPQYIEAILRGSMAGDHVRAWELWELMELTWPRLRKNAMELKNGVRDYKPQFSEYVEEQEQPPPSATEKMKLVSAALRTMRPDAAGNENALAGTINDIMDAWLKGVSILEIDWQYTDAGSLGQILGPRATWWVHPVCYGLSRGGRWGLRADVGGTDATTFGVASTSNVTEFPPNKFLIACPQTKSGPVLAGALLRPLAWWWCAANFSADWLLNLAQVFGLPFRWANYDPNAPQATIDSICNMLQNMGSAGWAAFPAGTTLELKEASKSGGDTPQADMLDRADKNCDLLLLGQTLTSDTGGGGKGGGSLALGKVHAGVKGDIIAAAASFVEDVIGNQLVPAVLLLNYGETSECPVFALATEKEDDLGAKAEMISSLAQAGAGAVIGLDWIGTTFGIPKPGPKEQTLADAKAAATPPALSTLPGQQPPTEKTPPDGDENDSIESRVARLHNTTDDALFAKELVALIGQFTPSEKSRK